MEITNRNPIHCGSSNFTSSMEALPQDIFLHFFDQCGIHNLSGKDFVSLCLVSRKLHHKMVGLLARIKASITPVFQTEKYFWSLTYDLKMGIVVSGYHESHEKNRHSSGLIHDLRTGQTRPLAYLDFEFRQCLDGFRQQ